jgi:hypothetical protein
MATPFTFTLDSFQITDTRSLHKDTDTSHSLLWLDPSDSSMMLPPKKLLRPLRFRARFLACKVRER